MCNHTNPIFHDEEKARVWLEKERWPDGVKCPHCGSGNKVKAIPPESMKTKATKKNPNPRPRKGWYHCNPCRKRFTVRTGTLYERSHIPLHTWLYATHLLCSSKKGISTHQLHRMLGITYKSAWFMSQRIREAMRPHQQKRDMGTDGGGVEIDETYFGNRETKKGKQGMSHKHAVLSLVDRTSGEVRSFHVDKVNSQEVSKIALRNIDREAKINTDEAAYYNNLKTIYGLDRQTVNHSKMEWVRGDVSTNTIEGYFSIFKRGMKGVYQHCTEAHLHRYLAEFDFRYSNRIKLGIDDAGRMRKAIQGIEGKRLTYRRIGQTANA